MKILCPIDFSATSLNGLEYAANMAKAIQGSISLLYVRISIWPEAIQLKRELNESNEDILSRLKLIAENIIEEFGIPCHFHIESTTLSFEEAVAKQAKDCDLIAMGTNGADNYYQFLFGSNSFHVMEKSACPVLIVPENILFRPIRVLVYAYDPETNPLFFIDQLKKLTLQIGARVKVLYVAEQEPSDVTEKKLEDLKKAVNSRAPRGIDWSFEYKYSTEVSQTMNQYVEENNADILALSIHHKTLIDQLLEENTVKRISATANYPVFVFWR